MSPTDLPLSAVAGRVRDRYRREGPLALLRRASEIAVRCLYLREEHVWYRLETRGERPRLGLPAGVELRRASAEEVRLAAELGQSLNDARAHHAGGHDLWLAREDGAPLFACWTFRGRAPVLAAPGGQLELAPDTVCLENSFTSPRARGRGIAPASWSQLADSLKAEGIRSIITKVETDNVPTRRALAKAGFQEIGAVALERVVGRKRTTMSPVTGAGEGEAAGQLRAGLGARLVEEAPEDENRETLQS